MAAVSIEQRSYINKNEYLRGNRAKKVMEIYVKLVEIMHCLLGHSEPIVAGLLIGAKKCREARGSYFV